MAATNQKKKSTTSSVTSFVIWNNKGGVGKTTLTFHTAAALACDLPGSDILVVDLCPQANTSTLLLNDMKDDEIMKICDEDEAFERKDERWKIVRGMVNADPPHANAVKSVFGYLSNICQQQPLISAKSFVVQPRKADLPNLYLLAGDLSLDLIAEHIEHSLRTPAFPGQQSKFASFMQSLDLFARTFAKEQGRKVVMLLDCSPQFSRYTQIAVGSAQHLVVPITPDFLAVQGLENVFRLVFGVARTPSPADDFPNRWREEMIKEKLSLPKLFCVVENKWPLTNRMHSNLSDTKKSTRGVGKVSGVAEIQALQTIHESISQCLHNLRTEAPECFPNPPVDGFLHLQALRVNDTNKLGITTLKLCLPFRIFLMRAKALPSKELQVYYGKASCSDVKIASKKFDTFSKALLKILR